MKRAVWILASAFFLSGTGLYKVQSLATVSFPQYEFEVDFPKGKAKEKTADFASSFGNVKRTEFVADQLNLLTGNISPCTREGYFVVRFFPLPAQYEDVPEAELFQLAKADILRDSNLSVLEEKDVELDGYRGLELTIDAYKGRAFAVQRIYVHKHAIYTQAVSTTTKECLSDKKNVQFLSSFHFIS